MNTIQEVKEQSNMEQNVTVHDIFETAREKARLIAQRDFEGALVPDRTKKLPKIDICRGPILGMGSVGIVHEMSNYAVKSVRDDDLGEHLLVRAMVDMAHEARYLSALSHPHIIKLHAVDGDTGSVLVLERLFDTLDVRISKWKSEEKSKAKKKSKLCGCRRGEDPTQQRLVRKQMSVAFDLSTALEYVHRRNIIHRDIRPQNIAFDHRDEVKLFDFGNARELKKELKTQNGMYKLTGMVGSPRYMAPEVAMGIPYNQKSDCYSFAILFWHIFSLKEPFKKTSRAKVRPPVPSNWPLPIRNMLGRSWCTSVDDRLPMAEIADILRTATQQTYFNGKDLGLTKRKSSKFMLLRK